MKTGAIIGASIGLFTAFITGWPKITTAIIGGLVGGAISFKTGNVLSKNIFNEPEYNTSISPK